MKHFRKHSVAAARLLIVVVIAAACAGVGKAQKVVDKTVATVSDGVLTE
jgi:hypothetical protein